MILEKEQCEIKQSMEGIEGFYVVENEDIPF